MKTSLLAFGLIGLLSLPAFACPGAGMISFELDGETVAVMDEYDALLTISEGYSLRFLNSKPSNASGGIGMIDSSEVAWSWICDERDLTNTKFRAERAFCHDLYINEDGAYILSEDLYGTRDYHVSLIKNGSTSEMPLVFRIDGAFVDPEQGRARGGCGKEARRI